MGAHVERSREIFGMLVIRRLRIWGVCDSLVDPSPACYHAEFGRSRSNGRCVITEIIQKSLTLRAHPSLSLEVIGTDTDRWATYDFLLVFHSMPYCFRDKWQYLKKKFLSLCLCWGGFLWIFVTTVGLKNAPTRSSKTCDEMSIRLLRLLKNLKDKVDSWQASRERQTTNCAYCGERRSC